MIVVRCVVCLARVGLICSDLSAHRVVFVVWVFALMCFGYPVVE